MSALPNIPFFPTASIQDKFKKFRKNMDKQHNERMKELGDKIKDIADKETKRAKDIAQEHKDFFTPEKEAPKSTTQIDFYEK